MVRISIYRGKVLRLNAYGHAGAAKKGHDLVCCAVSTLLYTLAAELTRRDCGAEISLCSGFALFSVPPQAEEAFSFAKTGLRLLAAQYPQYISLTEEQEETE